MDEKKQLNEEKLKEITLDDETLEGVSGGGDFKPVIDPSNTSDNSEDLKGYFIIG